MGICLKDENEIKKRKEKIRQLLEKEKVNEILDNREDVLVKLS